MKKKTDKKTADKKPLIERINALLTRTIRFVTYDIWRITENEVSGLKELYINTIKTVILAVRGFNSENLQTKASALTYSTFLAIVPLLAVLVGIAKGFGSPGSHQGKGWEQFTDSVIETVSREKNNVVFMLWGAYARSKARLIDPTRHLILEANHPSPLSANRGGWFGCGHFMKANQYLQSKGLPMIEW